MKQTNRKEFLAQAAALAGIMIVPRFVLGGPGYTAPSDMATLGFIGAGRQAITLQRNFADTGKVKMITACDVYGSKLAHFVGLLNDLPNQSSNACTTYGDFREVLSRKDVDAVVIATPDHWHGVMAVMAAEAKKDIYCEKPLALTVREGRDIADAVARNKVVFQTGSMQRSSPEFRQTANLVRNGYLGEITAIHVNIGGPPLPFDLPAESVPADLDWRLWLGPNDAVPYNHELNPVIGDPLWARWRYYKGLGGGDMTDWGAHMFDIVQWALDMDGKGPVKITPPDGQAYPVLTYTYENGIRMTQSDSEQGRFIVFEGTEGRIRVQRRRLETTPESLKDRVFGPNEKQVYHSDNHYLDFLQAMKTRKNPICPAEVGQRTNTVCTIGNIAYELGRPLTWDYTREAFIDDVAANKLLGRQLNTGWASGG